MDNAPAHPHTSVEPTPEWLAELIAEPDEAPVVSLWLARRLRDAGLAWTPAEGDRFVIPGTELDDRVFLIAPMVVEIRTVGSTRLIAFNGTTEWALDSVLASEALWLPGETDLRRALGERFVALRREEARWVVEASIDGATVPFAHPDAVGAFAVALLEVLRTG